MARPVQLAPSSLALVLSRLEAPGAVGGAEEPGGRAVFRAFRRANARCFWNSRLARAASRLAFQGWLRRGVLLVHAPPASLQVLRDAWCRRALRPPRGFRIRAVGDVFPVQMNPITQSQFIPLGEVLCCAISDMNATQIVVTQESLLEHLMKHYPGIAVPSQDILYTTLGTLIKERKIYHTGEGYFIVTPQTYFITNTTLQENKRAQSDENHAMPTCITYLVSMESCAELAKENASPISHCQSCRCFPDICTQDLKEPPAVAEMTRKGQKGLGESKSLVQNQAVSVSEENHISESTKPLPYTKDRDKGKKFGFSLFWRSLSRKEKSRTEHHSFSAQFPPEEWPVRDEDNLDNIPRDIEHEIIKRINPGLTVDNLIKHTILMQKYEEQKKYNSQGTSTDRLTVRHKYPSKEGVKKRQGRSAKSRRRGHSHRDRHRTRSQGSEPLPGSTRLEKHPKPPTTQPIPRIKIPNKAVVQKQLGGNPSELGSNLIYKKRINNPFQGLSHRGSPVTKGHNIQRTSDLKPSQIGPKGKPFQRSRSSDSSRIFERKAKQPCAEQCNDKLRAESIYMTNSSIKPVSDDVRDRLFNYSQGSVLQNDSKYCSFREGMLTDDVYDGKNEAIPEVLKKSYSPFDTLGEAKETQYVLPSPVSSSFDQASSACRLVDKTIHQFQNLDLLDYPVGANHLRQPERQDRDSEEKRMRKTFVQETETVSLENEVLSDDDQTLYQNQVEDDDGACSSLYLDEDDFSENDDLCQMLPGHIQYSFTEGSKWNHLGKQKATERSPTEYNSKAHRFEPPVLKGSEGYKPSGLLTKPGESQSPNLSAESCGLNLGTRSGFNCEEESSIAKCVQASASTDGNIFDYYSTRKAISETETLYDSVGDTGKKPASWSQSAQNQEMRKQFTHKLELFNTSHMPVLAQEIQHEHSHLEGTENSMAGDSGIDSPRTQSLASNNSVILDGLKRRQNFLQNFEGTKSSQTLTSNSLLQLTPVINV
ncbi:PREDICTED: storkhead-box protein 1 isoform X1 [Hipposideros armiger]|uniref:Storkhead-box protein 1 isoform X1 n=1 Tax=Hipposideros armiger TaxID=186990 RepID=A0A8B7PTX9_HIPAR|nr:PREDICTED: storkhead-box protein 1 isoform X1 [Hipposideros armiger]